MSSVCAKNVSSRIFKNACESIRAGHGDRGISHREPRDLSRPLDSHFSSATKLTRESHDAIAASRGTDVDARRCNLA